jgi:hypothetical protein
VMHAVPSAAQASNAAPPPWARAPMSPTSRASARIAVAEWRKAENRRTCRPLGFADVGAEGRSARSRRANFAGGWAVAFDLPNRRSAFGIAGAGVEGSLDDVDRWPDRIDWSDSSAAGFGLEGDIGPNHLAYLVIDGQGCLYNVWSSFGEDHLRYLLRNIRFIRT